MLYVKWGEHNIKGLESKDGISILYTEIDDEGTVSREIGLDSNGDVVHKAPTDRDKYGIFDIQKVDVSRYTNGIDPAEFDKLWNSSSAESKVEDRGGYLVGGCLVVVLAATLLEVIGTTILGQRGILLGRMSIPS